MPLYGIKFMSIAASCRNISAHMCEPVPKADDAKLNLPGLALASAINSATSFAFTEGCTSSTSGNCAIRPSGVKSLRGSKPALM